MFFNTQRSLENGCLGHDFTFNPRPTDHLFFPVPDCPLPDTYRNAMEHEINEEAVGWRRLEKYSLRRFPSNQNKCHSKPGKRPRCHDATDGLWTFYAFYTVDCINSWPGYGYAF